MMRARQAAVMGMVLDRRTVRDIVTLAVRKAPEEMCGLLLAREGSNYATEFRAIQNVHEDPERYYRMHSEAMTRIWEYARLNGLEIAGIVHSHPHGVAYPSATDLRLAAYVDIPYFIVALQPRALNAFILNGVYKGVTVKIEGGKPGLDYCWLHGRYEDALNCFQVCFECGHVYPDEQNLLDEHNKVLAEMDEQVDVFTGQGDQPVSTHNLTRARSVLGEKIWTCPMCCHDF